MAVKQGIARESAVLYPFAETRKALYEGAKQAMAAIPKCKPYRLDLPIKAKKQYLDAGAPEPQARDQGRHDRGRPETRTATGSSRSDEGARAPGGLFFKPARPERRLPATAGQTTSSPTP